MANLQVSLVTKSYGSKKLFEDVTVNLTAGKRYGLTGPNGAGKSTFMKILAGDLEPDTGSVARPDKTSVLRQDQFGYEDVRVLDVVLRGAKRLWAAITEKEKILALPNISDEDGHRLGELECIIAEEDGYSAESDAATLLAGLGIPADGFDGPMRELAGGLRLRVLLAQALFGKPDVLLLDEPTNNLDLDSIRWLEGFLCEYEGVLVTVSHDRHFLNAICTHIADIDYNTIITYTGSYDDMVLAKSQVRGRVEAENDDRRKKIAQLQDFVARFGAGTRASQVQSRKKEIEKLQVADLKKSNIERPFIQFLVKRPSGKQTLTLEGLAKSWPGLEVCRDFHALVEQGREGRDHRPQRRRQDHALSHARRRARAGRWHDRVGSRSLDRVHRARSRRQHPQGHHRRSSICTPSTSVPTCRTFAACSARCCSKAKRGRSRRRRSRAARRCGCSSPS